jgi:DNA-binding CsgD family transcriptional regulator/tetratricopeptide (TPR) repeat protein
VAAVSSSSEVEAILAGMAVLGLAGEALEPAEDAGLVRLVDGRLEFRHPLVRSAVYHAAVASDRRAAHRALAQGLAGSAHTEARAWHLAGAALGPDDEAADALEQAAEHARRRGGYASAAGALERAARLTVEPAAAAPRLCAAADAAWRAGRTDAARRLVTEALAAVAEGRLRAEALCLQGAVAYFAGNGDAAAAALLEAVDLLEALDRPQAVTAAADAVNALVRARQPERALETAQRARALAPPDGGGTDLEATVALGFALCFADRYGEAEPHLRRAAALFSAGTTIPSPLQAGRLSAALGWLGRHEDAHGYLTQTVRRARAAGAMGSLPHLLASSAWQALHASRWNEAYADAGEALALAEECDQPVTAAQALGVLTWLHALRGDTERCRGCGEETQRRSAELRFTLYGLLVSLCYGLLDVGYGRVEEAITHLEEVARRAATRGIYVPGVSPQLELAEALVRAGRAAAAEATLASFERSELAAVPLFAAQAERCRGLLARAEGFEPRFAAALELHEQAQSPFALARTHLAYGEQLRRAGQRVAARRQLRAALDTFERLGAAPWAERARAELRASGETLRRREPHEREQLTPQELQIAFQVCEGKSNKEVGAALFLSHKTIEFHLSRIYRKLGARSRAELIRLFATEPSLAAPA